jgi:DisA bacterial checkpoint controller nucleotide-binding
MPDTLEIVHALYGGFFERGVRYFFPDAALTVVGRAPETIPSLNFHSRTDGSLDPEWMGVRYHLERPGRPFTEDQIRMLGAIGAVLSARYRSIFFPASVASTSRLFEGLQEDRFVSAFLDHFPYLDENGFPAERDVAADAIEVLRESSLITYENRRISSGVILIGESADPERPARPLPKGALPYSNALVAIKSFHRLCDGLHTVFLVNSQGLMVDLVDVEQFSKACDGATLPAPSAARYRAHCLATLASGHTCLVLTPNGEIKIFSGGAQVLHFMEGRWHVSDVREKYREFRLSIGDTRLAERLFLAALNLAENRRGGLFVVLDHAQSASDLVAPGDFLEHSPPEASSKAQIHYLLCDKRVPDLELSVLQSIARVDGGIVMDRDGRLLAFGAILRNAAAPLTAEEGGRTTAAVHASRFGLALKISEDGMVSFYRGGERCWEI